MKLKKLFCLAFATIFSTTAFVACNKQQGQQGASKDANTLNINVYESGFGASYVYGWIDQFEALYAKEGYKINVVESNDSFEATTVTNAMIMGERNPIDLYIAGNVTPHLIGNTAKQNGMDKLAASLNDVFESKPINAKGEEESVTISQKLQDGYAEYFQLNGTYLAFPYRSAPVGLVVNPTVYSQYATEYPRTTGELLAVTKTIRDAGVKPFAFAGGNAYSYLHAVEDVWVAQYEGADYYADYCSFNNVNSSSEAEALIGNKGWEASLDLINQIQDPDNMEEGSTGFQHSQAQSNLITGKAAFMVTGSWLQNEMYKDYAGRVDNMEMIATPVISALGVKIGLPSDAVLSTLVKCVDENKTLEEAIAVVKTAHDFTVTEDQYTQVVEARGIFYDWGIPCQIVVNAYSKKLNIAKLFLRYIASDDAARIAYEASTMRTPFSSANVNYAEIGKKTAFLSSVNNITIRDHANYIYRQSTGKRADYSIGFFTKYGSLEKTVISNRELTGAKIIAAEQEELRKIWAERIG